MSDPSLPPPTSDDPLDALLAKAHWPESEAEAERDMIAAWDRISPARRSALPQWALWAMASAAVLLVALGLHGFRSHSTDPAPRVEVKDSPARSFTTSIPASAALGIPSRPATDYERMIMAAKPSPRRITGAQSATGGRSTEAEATRPQRVVVFTAAEPETIRQVSLSTDASYRRQVLGKMLRNGGASDVEAFLELMIIPGCRGDALAALSTVPSRHTAARLLVHFDDARIDYRFAAARALGAVCEKSVRGKLERMVRDNTHRREALAALLFCGHDEAFLAAVRADRSIDAQLQAVQAEVKRFF